MKTCFTPVLLCAALAGCAAPKSSTPPPPCTPLPPATQTQIQQVRTSSSLLNQSGSLNQQTALLAQPVTANSQRITTQWQGDAVPFLAQLARQRGIRFAWSGVRLPLPVDISVTNVTFEELLNELKVQIGWRAQLTQDGYRLYLRYTLPDKGGRA
jgi:defect in organelle trafficking protein DotD